MSDGTARPPTVWVLLGHRTGDNLQLEALAEALGWPWESKRMAWRRPRERWTLHYGRGAPSLEPLAAGARGQIAPPWPDLVLSAGWRSVPVARWIGAASGARLVHLGRPRAALDSFDLVLTTPQYRLPPAPNVLQLEGPLTRLSAPRLASAAEQWHERLAPYPRPRIAVMIGGNSAPMKLTPGAAKALGQAANAMARRAGGSLLVTSGPRTSPSAIEACVSQIDVPAHVHRWSEDAENPYEGYLALADTLIVTGDSVSMLYEACMSGKPVYLFELPRRGHWPLRLRAWADGIARAAPAPIVAPYLKLIREGWICPPRDVRSFHEYMLRKRRVLRLGDTRTAATPYDPDLHVARALAAVAALFRVSGASGGPRQPS